MTMMRTAFSPIFNEGLDFSCVALRPARQDDRPGASSVPAQIGATLFIVRWTLEELGVESFEPGDVVLTTTPTAAAPPAGAHA